MSEIKSKICHLTFDMAIGGTEQVIRQLVENTNRDKFDVSILCIDGQIGDIGQELIKQGIRIDFLTRQPGFDTQLIKDIRHYIKHKNVDVLHCHQYSPYVYGIIASILNKVKVVFTEHGRFYPDRSSWKRKLINPLFSLVTHKITAISKATKQALVEFENLPESKIQVIYNGIADQSQKAIDETKIKSELGLQDEIILGTISRLDSIKNHKMILSSFKEINSKYANTKLLIVGDGSLRDELESQSKELDISDKVIFTGFQIEPLQYLNCMDIFLLPSFSEGTSMTLLEAMSFSKPCVVTNVGGNPEIVIDKETGLVIENDKQSELTQSCIDLIENKDKRIQYGQAGRLRFCDNFEVTKMIKQFEEIWTNTN